MIALQQHWNAAYDAGDEGCSWTEHDERESFPVIRDLATTRDAVVDVGGGSSRLGADLFDAGYRDVTVVDIAPAALDLARERLGGRADTVDWICADLLGWAPARRYDLWHDRAVLHFFTDDADRGRYADTLRRAVAPGGHVVIATFAPDGPDRCSGLPVRRADAGDLMALLGPGFERVRSWSAVHTTPAGSEQRFTWLVARRLSRGQLVNRSA